MKKKRKRTQQNNAEVIANNGFIVLAYELWFKQILWELDSVRVIFQNGHVSQVNIHSGKIRTPLSLHPSLMYVSYIHFYLFIFLVEQPKEKIHWLYGSSILTVCTNTESIFLTFCIDASPRPVSLAKILSYFPTSTGKLQKIIWVYFTTDKSRLEAKLKMG